MPGEEESNRMGTIVADAPADQATLPIEIDFMYIDLEVCDRCRGTDANLETALAHVSSVLEASGREPIVRRTLVSSEEQARALGFVSSPTLRVNGRDIAIEFRQSRCESCESCSCNGTVECRVWVWQGQEYTEAPQAMIVEAILQEAYGGLAPQAVPAAVDVPENLRRFFAGKAQVLRAQEAPAACCSASEQASCCAAEEKASCCGDDAASGCGCR
jgi:hypothetical protein